MTKNSLITEVTFKICVLCMQLVSKINKLILAIFSDYTPCVRNIGNFILCCRLLLAFLYHEKHSLTYVV